MTPIYPTMWQMYPASGLRDLLDYLETYLLEDLTDEEFERGCEYIEPTRFCTTDDCNDQPYGNGMCVMHYYQVLRMARKAKRCD